MADVRIETAALILDKLRDAFGDYFHGYFDDELSSIPDTALPCVMVKELDGSVEAGPTGTDSIIEKIQIIIAFNTRDDLGANASRQLTGAKLRDLVKGQTADGHYKDKTIMTILRKNYSMNDTIVSQSVEFDFDVAQRGPSLYTKEAYITVQTEHMALVERN
jgi:hypothetical protein